MNFNVYAIQLFAVLPVSLEPVLLMTHAAAQRATQEKHALRKVVIFIINLLYNCQ